MAGTTVHDDGLVQQAFTVAVAGQGVAPGTTEYERMGTIVRKTRGQSTIEVFRLLLGGDERRAQAANETFEEAYGLLVDDGAVRPIPGAAEAMKTLRAAGIKVALLTGFARTTQEAIIDALGWRDTVDIAAAAGAFGRGRPFPDLVLASALRLGVDDVREIAVVGDTPLDMMAGLRAGAGLVAGVLTGAGDRQALLAAGATHIIGSIGELPGLLGVD
jgi:phosphoglycolate phosphatase